MEPPLPAKLLLIYRGPFKNSCFAVVVLGFVCLFVLFRIGLFCLVVGGFFKFFFSRAGYRLYTIARNRLFLDSAFLKKYFYTNVLNWFQKLSMHPSYYEALLIFVLHKSRRYF